MSGVTRNAPREKFSGPAKSGQHLVEDQQRTDAIASLAQACMKSRAGYTHPALRLHRLDHDRGHGHIDRVERDESSYGRWRTGPGSGSNGAPKSGFPISARAAIVSP